MTRRVGLLALVGATVALAGCGDHLSGAATNISPTTTVAATTTVRPSPLACATALGETLANVRTWLGIAADGSQDQTIRVVDLHRNTTAQSTYLLSSGKDLVCGSPKVDLIDGLNVTSTEQSYMRAGDVVLGGDDTDVVDVMYGGVFRGGLGDDQMNALNGGAFDGGAGNDYIGDAMGGGKFIGGDGDDVAQAMSGGIFDGGAGFDSSPTHIGGTLINVEQCEPLPGVATAHCP